MDKDLEFLNGCTNEQLQLLADCLVFSNGKKRLFETLSKTENYTKYYPDTMQPIIPDIVDELQRCGGNKIKNMFRGHGVTYKSLLTDVCKIQNVNFNKNNTVEQMEQYLLQKVVAVSVEKMTDEDIKKISEDWDVKEIRRIVMAGGKLPIPFLIRATTVIMAGFFKKVGLKVALNVLTKIASGRLLSILTGPLGWAASGVWMVYDLLGPSYKAAVPAVVTISYYRFLNSLSVEERESALS